MSKQIAARIPDDVAAAISAKASSEDRSMANIIRRILTDAIRQSPK
jgi:hypothetical protein